MPGKPNPTAQDRRIISLEVRMERIEALVREMSESLEIVFEITRRMKDAYVPITLPEEEKRGRMKPARKGRRGP